MLSPPPHILALTIFTTARVDEMGRYGVMGINVCCEERLVAEMSTFHSVCGNNMRLLMELQDCSIDTIWPFTWNVTCTKEVGARVPRRPHNIRQTIRSLHSTQ